MVEKTDTDTRKILEALDYYGENGCGIISLSLDTGLSQQQLRSFFRKYKSYCIPLAGNNKYKLNRLTEESGSVEKMLVSIEQKMAEERVNAKVTKAFTWGLVLGAGISFFGDWAVNFYDWLF